MDGVIGKIAVVLGTLLGAAGILLAPRPAMAQPLPQAIEKPFAQAQVPLSSLGLYVIESGAGKPVAAHRESEAMNPASVMKLLTTYVALEQLTPAYTFRTEVFAGPLAGDVVKGDLYIRGHGDPKLTIEDFWLLLRSMRGRGLREIRGDLVIDNSFFDVPPPDPNGFDSRWFRAYNTSPEATMVNFKAVAIRFVADRERGTLRVYDDPGLPQVKLVNEVRLKEDGVCPYDWRANITRDVQGNPNAATVRLAGTYVADCGEKVLEFNLLGNNAYIGALFRQLWTQLGGSFAGKIREGLVPSGGQPLLVWESPPLGELVRDINKWSNNLMARQVFLTLGAELRGPPGTQAKSADTIRAALTQYGLDFPELVLENGSGLSRQERISAKHLAELLVHAQRSAVMPELMASLPIVSIDGTMKKRLVNNKISGKAHIKTGTLEGVKAMAGFVLAQSGKRFVVVCMVNHTRAGAAEDAMDDLLGWIHDNN